MNVPFASITTIATLLAASALSAQTDSCLRRTILVNVVNSEGKHVTGFGPADFQASINNMPVKVLSVAPNPNPARVMILLDSSGSMLMNSKKWQAYLNVAEDFLTQLPSSNLVGLIVFRDRVEVNGQIPISRDRIHNKFEQLRSLNRGGGTALWDALNTAALQFDPPLPGDSIYAISDGDDDASRMRSNDLKEVLLKKGVRLFMFTIGPSKEEARLWKRISKIPDELVRNTGGNWVVIPESHIESLSSAPSDSKATATDWALISLQAASISQFELLQIELPASLNKLTDWKLTISRPDASVLSWIYPHALAPCSTPKAN